MNVFALLDIIKLTEFAKFAPQEHHIIQIAETANKFANKSTNTLSIMLVLAFLVQF